MLKSLRVFVVDDHAMFREGIKLLVNAQPDMEVIGEADGGRTAWQQIKQLQPDIVLMDVSMPDMSGVQATRHMKQEYPDLKVLILTAHEDQGCLRQLLQAGAMGYVLKRVASKELIHAIHVVMAGGVYLDPTLAGKVVSGYLGHRHDKSAGTGSSDLSERETEVLRLIAMGHSNKEIASQLDISVKTIETYKARLMIKLELHSRADIVRFAIQQGWMYDS